jgi:hypothetical protein
MHPLLLEEQRIADEMLSLQKTDLTAIARGCLHAPYLAERVAQRIIQIELSPAKLRRGRLRRFVLAVARQFPPLSRIPTCATSRIRSRHRSAAGRPATAGRREANREHI